MNAVLKIKKAYDCCQEPQGCEECPYGIKYNMDCSGRRMVNNARQAIGSLEKRIRQLERQIEEMTQNK